MLLSVVICSYNREQYLLTCLEHLADQAADPELFELVIVNNNSPDNTHILCENFITNHPHLSVNYCIEKQQGHTYARNRGIEESQSDLIAFLDDDAFVDRGYVMAVIKAFEKQSTMAIGGKIDPIYEDGEAPKWMSRYLLPLVSALDLGDKQSVFKGTKHPIGANMAFRSSVFETLGQFDVLLGRRGSDGLEGGDEKELFSRMKMNKLEIIYEPTVYAKHIIGSHRTTEQYVKGLAIGVGSSEKKRLSGLPFLVKWIAELLKSAGSLLLFVIYSCQGQFSAAWMLLKFRYWVFQGLLKK
jgi:glycosyltransferase involved in cell wall biosynthesis